MTAVETRELTKRYGAKVAVKNLNISVAQGELYALLGVNGAGKTTTIKMLSCLSAPTGGEAFLLGESIRNSLKVKERIAVSPQETAVAPNLKVSENLELMCGINGANRKEAKRIAADTIAAFGMEEIAKDRAATLSGGWQRRLSIVMALITEPEILFLDEPTLGLDVLARRELWSVIEGLKGRITIILTTHYMGEAESLADRIGIMKAGELIAEGTADELMRRTGSDNFEDAFVALSAERGIET
jgi:ABC-2 type transport system ATP-binding protein